MSDLESFQRQVSARVKAAAEAPLWPLPEFDSYMAALQARRRQFEEAATSLIANVVKPRLDTLLDAFPSARIVNTQPAHRCCCWLAASDRYPVTAKVEFTLERDEAAQHLFVRYEAALIPQFVPFQPHDRLTLPVGEAEPARVADWVEKRILEFLEAYLHYDRGGDDLEEDVVTDPVCGMRLSRSAAKERSEYRGHPYFFCSTECRQQFEADPARLVTVRML